MEPRVNEHGVTQFPKGDIRRLFVFLYALEVLESPTLVMISAFTGLNRGSIETYVSHLKEQLGVEVAKTNATYTIISWGTILEKRGVLKAVAGHAISPKVH